MTIEADLALARLDAEAVTSEDEAAGVIRRAEAAYKQGREEFDRLRAKLPTTLRKLTAGYEMRTYWFEIFECGRKVALWCACPSSSLPARQGSSSLAS
eukprot:7388559-Prymnesium_polylepis.1